MDSPQQQPLAGGRRWSFGNVVLDERTLELFVDGVQVKIERKPLEVLIYLIQHAGEVVTKDELFEHVWDRRVFDDGVLSKAISSLRLALGPAGHEAIVTVRGFGYRMVAKLAVDASQPVRPQPSAVPLEVGVHPPHRPHWRLVERLGIGGLGEAWLARHEKTNEPRVFKFARDGAALTSLRREVTLYRVISDTLGARAAIVHIFDWNLDQEPYFLEIEYVEGRDLQSWASAHGGLLCIPLDARLNLAAQIAEAVAAAHSVGVLHKDLKPANVLIQMASDNGNGPAEPRAKLCDFGSGGMADADRLQQLGITRMGFTATTEFAGGTALYLAPEVISGNPATQKADVYALGVMLYQLVVGSFQKTLAPGWEADIQDELLKEDIASAAAGASEKRLASAEALASMLGTLEVRRETRRAERAHQERIARTQETYAKLRRARVFIAASLVLTITTLTGGVLAYLARNQAIEANETAQAINAFLTDDVLGIDPSVERPSEASYESLLARAAAQIDKRFADQPDAAANLHLILGRRYQEIGNVQASIPEFERSVTLFGTQRTRFAVAASEKLATVYFDRGRTADALLLFDVLVANCTARYGGRNLATLLLRTKSARALLLSGDLRRGESRLRGVLKEIPFADPLSEDTRALFKEWFGVALTNDISAISNDEAFRILLKAHANSVLAEYLMGFAGDYQEAESLFREALSDSSTYLGDEGELIAESRLGLAAALVAQQRFGEAEQLIRKATGFFDSWLPPHHWLHAAPTDALANLRLEQGHIDEAIALYSDCISICGPHGCSRRIVEGVRFDFGLALQRAGRVREAEEIFRTSLAAFEAMHGKNHLQTLSRRISLANALLEENKSKEALAALADVTPTAIDALPRADHLLLAELNRARGVIALRERRVADAIDLLRSAWRIFNKRLGTGHWKTKQSLAELEKARLVAP